MLENELREILKRLYTDAILVGVGNDISGDDAFGPTLIEKVKGFFGNRAIDAGLAPENWASKISSMNPTLIVIADAVAFGGYPGEIRLMKTGSIDHGFPSTHGPGLGMFIEYLKDLIMDVEFVLLAVQPERTGFGEPISEPVKIAIEEIMSVVKSTPPEIMRP